MNMRNLKAVLKQTPDIPRKDEHSVGELGRLSLSARLSLPKKACRRRL